MKNLHFQKLFYGAAIISTVVLFAGCADMSGTADISGSQQNLLNPQGQSNQADPEAQTQPQIPVLKMSEADEIAYQAAITNSKIDFCDKIENVEAKTQCQTEVKDKIAFNDAISKSSTQECAKISNTEQEKACEMKIGINTELQNETQKNMDEGKKADEIAATGDIAKCKSELTVPAAIAACQSSIIIPQASTKKDPTLCNQIEDTKSAETCKEIVNGTYKP